VTRRGSSKLALVGAAWQIAIMARLDWRWLDLDVDTDRRAWTAVLGRCRHDVHQLPRYVELEARRLGGRPAAVVIDEPEGAALLPVILRELPSALGPGLDASSPYGYPAPVFGSRAPGFAHAAVDAMVSALRERSVVSAFVRLHPLLDAPLAELERHGQLVDHGPTVWIDLSADEATQWAEHRSTHRNLIRRARREGLRVRFDDAFAELDAFFEVYAQTMVRVEARWSEFGRAYLHELAAALGERGFLALVEDRGQVVAGGVFTRCGGLVQYHLSGTASAWQRASPSRLLLDEVRRRSIALGDRCMHLGGGVGAREDPLYRFKRGFSRQRGRFHSWRVIVDELAYAKLVARWVALGGDPTGRAELFPRYRAPVGGVAQEAS
jgi:hypothetical protein